MSAGNFDNFPL